MHLATSVHLALIIYYAPCHTSTTRTNNHAPCHISTPRTNNHAPCHIGKPRTGVGLATPVTVPGMHLATPIHFALACTLPHLATPLHLALILIHLATPCIPPIHLEPEWTLPHQYSFTGMHLATPVHLALICTLPHQQWHAPYHISTLRTDVDLATPVTFTGVHIATQVHLVLICTLPYQHWHATCRTSNLLWYAPCGACTLPHQYTSHRCGPCYTSKLHWSTPCHTSAPRTNYAHCHTSTPRTGMHLATQYPTLYVSAACNS